MNLRTKFVVLVVGITVLPILAMLLVFVFQYGFVKLGFEREVSSMKQYYLYQHWVRGKLSLDAKPGTLADYSKKIPTNLELTLVDQSFTVLDSTATAYRVGQAFPTEDFTASGYEYQILPFEQSELDGARFLVVRFPYQVWNMGYQNFWGLLVPFSLLVFGSVMSIQITRSIKQSISTLETAARRIAKGDLDFQLEATGSDELASLTRSFNTMRKQLKDEYARRARFIMGVSHDLRTPLTLIEGYVDAILEGYADQPEKLDRYLQIIKEKSTVLEGRIAQLIEFVKMDMEEWTSTHVQTNFSQFLDELAIRYREDASLLKYTFSSSIKLPGTLYVTMDPVLVTRAFENLLNNAIRYADVPKVVGFDAWIDQGHIYVNIRNNGAVISAKDIDHIFEPFYRGSNSRKEDGFGLGLSTVKSIFAAHGWVVAAYSAPDEETVFTVSLPKGAHSSSVT